MKESISFDAEKNKQLDEIDKLERDSLRLLEESKLIHFYDSQQQAKVIVDSCIEDLQNEFRLCSKSVDRSKYNAYETYLSQKEMFINNIPLKIIKKLGDESNKISYKAKYEINVQLIQNLMQLNCAEIAADLDRLRLINHMDYIIRKINFDSTLEKIKKLTVSFEWDDDKNNSVSFSGLDAFCRASRDVCKEIYKDDYYGGFKSMIRRTSSKNDFLKGRDYDEGRLSKLFDKEIQKIRPYLISCMVSFIESTKSESVKEEDRFNSKKKEVAKRLKNKADQLRKEAEISAIDKEKLVYLQTLLQQTERIILLEGGDTHGN